MIQPPKFFSGHFVSPRVQRYATISHLLPSRRGRDGWNWSWWTWKSDGLGNLQSPGCRQLSRVRISSGLGEDWEQSSYQPRTRTPLSAAVRFETRQYGSANVPGLPRLAEATFHGSFPTAHLEFHDDALPVFLSLDAFSSFQPVDADMSGLPSTMLSYSVRNPGHQSVEVVIAWSLENPIGNGSHRRNEIKISPGVQGILMDDPSLQQNDPLRGTVALAALEEQGGKIAVRAYWHANNWNMGAQSFWFDSFSKTGDLGQESDSRSPIASVSIRHTIPAGEKRTYRFLVVMAFAEPNSSRLRLGSSERRRKRSSRQLLLHSLCRRLGSTRLYTAESSRN